MGYKQADRLAEEGPSKHPINKSIPHADCVPKIREIIRYACHFFFWTPEASGNVKEITVIIHPRIYSSVSCSNETALCRLRIGCTGFSHSYLMNKDHQAFCDEYLVAQTVKHLLVECSSVMELRNLYWYFKKDRNESLRLDLILGKDVSKEFLD